MKPIVGWAAALLCLLATACVHTPPARQDAAMAVRAMTFNIRLDIASDGENAWPNRKEHVFDLIRHEAPDVLGMQEVLLDQKCDLEAALPGYAFLGVARDDCLMVGDSPADIDAAKNAGMRSIAVRGGYTRVPVDELGADRVIDTLSDLRTAIEATLAPAS